MLTTSDDPEEQSYLNATPACTDGSETVIVNNSEAVWYFINVSGGGLPILSSGEDAASFREFVGSSLSLSSSIIVPTEMLRMPSQAENVAWHIDRELTKTWLAHEVYLATFEKYSMALKRQALTNGSKSRKAVFDCTMAYWELVRNGVPLTQSVESENQVLDLFSIAAGGGSCASSWRAAESEAGNVRFPTWLDDVAKAGKIAENVTKVHTSWQWVQRLCVAIPKFC
ncbi:hypothetical protein [Homoserinimonas sp. OAct 916]|uniref:hypothetical protein n=1 Tax=Homoserinimonas sp. OAct 916 TaxID=2211450 RepID=UPI000DBEA584|nr:hypothetical protein [Homoserinimonas sp. OAct 916]